jgi:1-acyl-sn-glycerol-3-phosphate acyltransferase
MSSILEQLKSLRPVRKLVYAVVGAASYPGLALVNKIEITGTEHLKELPRNNVLFVSNHQTFSAP